MNKIYIIRGGYNNGAVVYTRADAERLAKENKATHGKGKIVEGEE